MYVYINKQLQCQGHTCTVVRRTKPSVSFTIETDEISLNGHHNGLTGYPNPLQQVSLQGGPTSCLVPRITEQVYYMTHQRHTVHTVWTKESN